MMNGFNDHGLDEDAFGASKGGIVSSFDAFREYTLLYVDVLQVLAVTAIVLFCQASMRLSQLVRRIL
jgi:23S rRNA G2069 N7-methylase RlmK/C1962 C5-methylase RlmI